MGVIEWLMAANRLAASLERLHEDAERYMDGVGIPPRVDAAEVDKLRGEPAVGERREEWEIAVDEERERRRQESDREESL